jgi:hypothetical protein
MEPKNVISWNIFSDHGIKCTNDPILHREYGKAYATAGNFM